MRPFFSTIGRKSCLKCQDDLAYRTPSSSESQSVILDDKPCSCSKWHHSLSSCYFHAWPSCYSINFWENDVVWHLIVLYLTWIMMIHPLLWRMFVSEPWYQNIADLNELCKGLWDIVECYWAKWWRLVKASCGMCDKYGKPILWKIPKVIISHGETE